MNVINMLVRFAQLSQHKTPVLRKNLGHSLKNRILINYT